MNDRPGKTRWFNPDLLVITGIRAALSSVFGQFADRRESEAYLSQHDLAAAMQAARRRGADKTAFRPPLHDFQDAPRDENKDLWLDFMADTGDGWQQTFAMAELLCKEHIQLTHKDEELSLPRGHVLILGGDQVYPYASKEEYEARLISPFEEAAMAQDPGSMRTGSFGHLFAIPGNHDWYDGLRAFLGQFCRSSEGLRRGKIIGGRHTVQTRSYFALRLPNNWWLWGLDSQLEGYIDQPQVDFFADVSKSRMDGDAQLILCTGYPSWTDVDPNNPGTRFGSFAYMERLISNYSGAKKSEVGTVRLAISGDSHHYARHIEKDFGASASHIRHYVTSGGGGAYTHPTSQFTCLNGKAKSVNFAWEWPKPGEILKPGQKSSCQERLFQVAEAHDDAPAESQPALYPTPRQSRIEAMKALAFPFYNIPFTGLMCLLSALLIWSMPAGVIEDSLPPDLTTTLIAPWTLLHFAAMTIGLRGLADYRLTNGRWLAGALLAAGHVLITYAVAREIGQLVPGPRTFVIVLAALLSGFAAASLLGFYFVFMFQLFGKHWNEVAIAISSTRYKSFLRMCFHADGRLTLYAIGLDQTELSLWQRLTGKVRPRAHLIERVELPAR